MSDPKNENYSELVENALMKERQGADITREKEMMKSPEVDAFLNRSQYSEIPEDAEVIPISDSLTPEEMEAMDAFEESGEDVRITDPGSIKSEDLSFSRGPSSTTQEKAQRLLERMRKSRGEDGPLIEEDKEVSDEERGESFFEEIKKEATWREAPGSSEILSFYNAAKGLAKGSVKIVEDAANLGILIGNKADDFLAEMGVGKDDPDWERATFGTEPGDSIEEKVFFGIGRYLTPYMGAFRLATWIAPAMSTMQKGITAAGMGSLFNAMSVDPEDKNLAELSQGHPYFDYLFPDFLATDADDSEAIKRLKFGLESLYIDLGTFGTIRAAKKAADLTGDVVQFAKTRRELKKAREFERAAAQKAEQMGKETAGEAGQKGASDGGPTVDNDATVYDINTGEEIPKNGKKGPTPEQEEYVKYAEDYYEGVKTDTAQGFKEAENIDEMFDTLRNSDDPGFKKTWEDFKRGTMDKKEFIKKSQAVYNDTKRMKRLLNRKPGTPVNSEEMGALGMHLHIEGTKLAKLTESMKVIDGALVFENKAHMALFKDQFARFRQAATSVNGGVSESMRVGRFWQDAFLEAKDAAKKSEVLEEYLRLAPEDLDFQGRMIKKIMDKKVPMADLAHRVHKLGADKSMSDVLYEIWYNAALSGTSTHIINTASNATMMLAAPIEKTVAAAADKMIYTFNTVTGKEAQRHVYMREGWSMINSYMETFVESITEAAKVFFKNEIPPNMSQKFESVKNQAWSRSMEKPVKDLSGDVMFEAGEMVTEQREGLDKALSYMINGSGYVVNIPSRALTAMDTFFKIQAHRAQLKSQATALALQNGKKPGSKEFNNLIDNYMKNPPTSESMAAERYAQRQTFTQPIETTFGGSVWKPLQTTLNNAPGGKAVVPFFRIITTLNDAVIRRTPMPAVLGMLNNVPGLRKMTANNLSNILKNGGPESRELIAQMTTGTSMMAVGAWMASNGMLTGAGPRDYRSTNALRTQRGGRPENSIRIDGTHYNLEKYQPFSTLLLTGADMAELSNWVPEGQEHKMEQYVAGAVSIFIDRMTPEFLTEGLPGMFTVLRDLQDGKTNLERFQKVMTKFMQTVAAPNFFKQTIGANVRAYKGDTAMRDLKGDATKGDTEAQRQLNASLEQLRNSFLESIGITEGLPKIRNIFAEEVQVPVGLAAMNPFAANPGIKNDYVYKELERLRLTSKVWAPDPLPGEAHLQVSMPQRSVSKTVAGKSYSVDLSPYEYEKLVFYCAGLGEDGKKMTGVTPMKERLEKKLKEMDRLKKSDEARKYAIKEIIEAYRTAGIQRYIYKNDDVKKRIVDRMMERKEKLIERQDAEDQLDKSLIEEGGRLP